MVYMNKKKSNIWLQMKWLLKSKQKYLKQIVWEDRITSS